jgi:hypothetical protein
MDPACDVFCHKNYCLGMRGFVKRLPAPGRVFEELLG